MHTDSDGHGGDWYPRAQVTHLEQLERPDGYEATLGLLLEHEDASTARVEVAVAVTEYAGGSTWQADIRYDWQLAPLPDTALVQMRTTVTYGEVQGGQRADTYAISMTCASGQQVSQTKLGRPRPAHPPRRMSLDEFRQRFALFGLAREDMDKAESTSQV